MLCAYYALIESLTLWEILTWTTCLQCGWYWSHL